MRGFPIINKAFIRNDKSKRFLPISAADVIISFKSFCEKAGVFCDSRSTKRIENTKMGGADK